MTIFGLQGRSRANLAGGSDNGMDQGDEEDPMLFGRITLKSCLKAVRAVE